MPEAAPPSQAAKKPKSGWISVLVDYGPLLVFFLTYRYYKPEGEDAAGEIFAVIRGTGAFIVAALAALAISKWRLGKVSPMLWLFLPLSFLFTFTQLPMLLRHGLTVEGAKEEETTPPPTG